MLRVFGFFLARSAVLRAGRSQAVKKRRIQLEVFDLEKN